jgi:membrane associated rhomboid family serine protease
MRPRGRGASPASGVGTFGLLLLLLPLYSANDLSYPTPPNPFAKGSGATAAPDLGAIGDGGLLPGLGLLDDPSLEGGGPLDAPQLPGDAIRPPLPPGDPPGAGSSAPMPEDVLPIPATTLAKPRRSKGGIRLRPMLCLGALAATCSATRPREAALLGAIDEHHHQWGQLIGDGLREQQVEFFVDAGIGTAAVHTGLVWLGLLGQWLPLLPVTSGAIEHWAAVVGAPQLLVLSVTLFYLLRKLLPRKIVDGHLSVSFDSVLRRGRLHTLVTAAFSPVGLVHWLHAVVILVACGVGLDGVMSRGRLVAFYAAAGACSSLLCVLSQLLLGRRAQARSSVSGGAMGILLLRAAVLPEVRGGGPVLSLPLIAQPAAPNPQLTATSAHRTAPH